MFEEKLIKRNKSYNVIEYLSIIPIITSLVCAIYVVIIFHYIVNFHNDISHFKNVFNNINFTKIELITNNLLLLEECVLNKLQLCSI